jgi:hypothetical protein
VLLYEVRLFCILMNTHSYTMFSKRVISQKQHGAVHMLNRSRFYPLRALRCSEIIQSYSDGRLDVQPEPSQVNESRKWWLLTAPQGSPRAHVSIVWFSPHRRRGPGSRQEAGGRRPLQRRRRPNAVTRDHEGRLFGHAPLTAVHVNTNSMSANKCLCILPPK